MGLFGIAFSFLALRGGGRKPGRSAKGSGAGDLDRLLGDIGRGLRLLSSPGRMSGIGLVREKQDEVERQLAELQSRMRHLEDGVRERYEDRAQRILEQAARYGITLPPP